MLTRVALFLLLSILAACPTPPPQKPEAPPAPPERSGSSLVLDLTPNTIPPLEGAFGFDLLGKVSATACATRSSDVSFWVASEALAKLGPDSLTHQAIAAAMLDAVASLDSADTMIVTRAVTEGKGADKVCATVHGRAIRLTKAHAAPAPSDEPALMQP